MRDAKVIGITSGKGGVGKTTITANLAQSLTKMGCEVLIIDGDFALGNLEILLKTHASRSLGDVIDGECDLREAIVEVRPRMHVLPASSGDFRMLKLNNYQRKGLFDQFEGLFSEMDFVLVDTGAGMSEDVLFLNTHVDQNIIVTTPEPTALADAYAMIKVLSRKYKIREFGVFINMLGEHQYGERIFSGLMDIVEKYLHVRLSYLGSAPKDDVVSKSVLNQSLFVNTSSQSRAAISMKKLALKINSLKKFGTPSKNVLWKEMSQSELDLS